MKVVQEKNISGGSNPSLSEHTFGITYDYLSLMFSVFLYKNLNQIKGELIP